MEAYIVKGMTNLIFIVLTNVAAMSWVEWSNDLTSWQCYSYICPGSHRVTIAINPLDGPKQFWRWRTGPKP